MKRVLSLVLALVMVFGTIMPAFAESTDSQAGQDLESYGIIAGDGTGLNESGTLTRAEMTVILAKLNGKATEAAAYAFESAFTDDADAWYTPWVAYAATQGWMSGYPDGTFKPSNVISAQEVNVLMVKALGYDVEWATANTTAADLGVAVTAKDAAKVLRGEIFTTLRAALDVNAKDATDTLGTALALTGYVSPTPATPETLEIAKVMTDNLKTIVVEFNQELNKKTVNTTNFKVTGLTVQKALLSEDMKTVTLQMSAGIAQSKEVELVVTKVKTSDDGLTLADYKVKHVVNDVTIPVIESITVIDAKHVKVQASEPMNWEAATFTVLSGVKLDGKTFVGKVEADHQNFTYTIEFNSVKKEGSYTLNVEGVKDFAGLAAVKKDFAFDVAKDDTAPVALSAIAANVNAVEVTFDEPLATIGSIKINGKATTETFKANSGSKVVVATFTDSADKLTLGATVEVVVVYKGQKDVVGNEVKTDTELTFKVEDDTALPTATVEIAKANKVTITFSKSMDVSLGKIIVMDTASKVKKTVNISGLASTKWSETNTILTLVGSDLGLDNTNPVDRIIQLKDMKDNTVRANLLATTDYSVAVLDTKTPVVTAFYTVSLGTDLTPTTDYKLDDTITFYFSEAMDEDTVKNLSNFKRNSEAGTFATVANVAFKSIATDGKSAVFTYPDAGTFSDAFTVFALKDLAGNMVGTVTNVVVNAASLAGVPSVVAKSDTSIEVTYNVAIATADPSSIVIDGASAAYTTATSASIDGKVVTYTLAKALPTDTTGITVELNNKDLLVSVFGDKYTAAWTLNAATVTDAIVPTITAIADGKWDTTIGTPAIVAAPNFAVLTFSETLAALPGTLTDLQQDIVIKLNDKILDNADYTLTLVNNKYVNIEVYSNTKVTTDDKYELSVEVVRASEFADPIGNALAPVTNSITDFDYNYTALTFTAESLDGDNDGDIETVKLTFNRNITDADVNAAKADFSFSLVSGMTSPVLAASIDGDADNNNVITLTLASDLATTGSVYMLYTADAARKIDDAQGVVAATKAAALVTDAAKPVLVSSTLGNNGVAQTLEATDTLTLVFTEPMNTTAMGTFTVGAWTIGAGAAFDNSFDVTSSATGTPILVSVAVSADQAPATTVGAGAAQAGTWSVNNTTLVLVLNGAVGTGVAVTTVDGALTSGIGVGALDMVGTPNTGNTAATDVATAGQF